MYLNHLNFLILMKDLRLVLVLELEYQNYVVLVVMQMEYSDILTYPYSCCLYLLQIML